MEKTLIKLMLAVGFFFMLSCQPKQGTVEDKGAVKGDSIDVREGAGEGPVGEGDMGTEQDDGDNQ